MASQLPPVSCRNVRFVAESFNAITGKADTATKSLDYIYAPLNREVPMKILCLGWSRTGTVSLMSALTQLGYRPYHMSSAYANANVEFPCWTEALEIKYGIRVGKSWGRIEFDKLLGRYDCLLDVPCMLFWKELILAYPEAKIILTERPVEGWIRSMQNTVSVVMPWRSWNWFSWADKESAYPWYNFIRLLMYVGFNNKKHWRVDCKNEDEMRHAYLSHYQDVRAFLKIATREFLEIKIGKNKGKE